MTLQNGLVHRDRAYLWCDEAFFETATGKFSHMQHKAMKSLTWPYALSVACIGGNPQEIFHAVASTAPTDLASLLSAVSDALRAYSLAGNLATILVAAWEDEAQLLRVATNAGPEGEPAFEPMELLHQVCTGTHLPAYHKAVAVGLTPENMAGVIDAQIEAPFTLEGPTGSSAERIWFGGGVVEIEVSQTGIRDRVLRLVDQEAGSHA